MLSAIPATNEAIELLSFTLGESIRVHWSLGWPDIFDAIGGTPRLVDNGAVALAACTTGFCANRLPRTGVGFATDGRVFIVVVDGGKKKYSVGMSLQEFAEFFVQLGGVEAMNLDGGGSSTMVVKGEVVNRPSNGNERSVSSALLVLPGPDDGEPPPSG